MHTCANIGRFGAWRFETTDDDKGSNFPLFIKEASSPDDTFKILNASFHGKGKGGFAQICAHRRQPDPCLILESPSYRRNDKNQGKFVSFKKNFNHTYYKFHQPRFFNANGYVWNYLTHVKVSWIQNEFVRSLFLPKCQPKIWRISALPSNQLPG